MHASLTSSINCLRATPRGIRATTGGATDMRPSSFFHFCSRCGCLTLAGQAIVLERSRVVGWLCDICLLSAILQGLRCKPQEV